jgi:hypothetical protein
VFAAALESSWTIRASCPVFKLAPVVDYNSGHPFNLLAGADINGNNHFINDRPRGSPRNSSLGPNCVDFDATLSRAFKFGDRYNLLLDHTSNDEPRSFWLRAANPQRRHAASRSVLLLLTCWEGLLPSATQETS